MCDGRLNVVYANGDREPMANYVWNKEHPDDPVMPGEVIHHEDNDKTNDSPGNLQKMSAFDHKSYHSGVGVKALAKWRKENPEKASNQSSKNAHALQVKLATDPELRKKIDTNRRKTIQSKAYRKKMSEALKRHWRKKKEEQKCQV